MSAHIIGRPDDDVLDILLGHGAEPEQAFIAGREQGLGEGDGFEDVGREQALEEGDGFEDGGREQALEEGDGFEDRLLGEEPTVAEQ